MLLALAAAEAGLRLAGWSRPQFFRPDPRRGWALAPGARGLFTEEGRGWMEINAAGFRGGEHRREPPPGVLRVALLGDSMSEGRQVDLEDTFGEVLEARLGRCPALPGGARRAEVLNFGVSGYGTAQELLTLRHQALAWHPHVVLLAVYAGNDVLNNLEVLENDPLRPYFRLDRNGELVLDDSFREERAYRLRTSAVGPFAYWLLGHSRLLQLAQATRRGRLARREAAAERRLGRADAPGEVGLDDAVYSPPATPEWREAWRVTEALIAAIAEESRAAGARPALVTLTTGIQVHPVPAVRRRYAARLGVDDLAYPDRRLVAAARRVGMPALALAGPLRRLATERRAYFHGFEEPPRGGDAAPDVEQGNRGHWNRLGHRAAGEAIASWLCRGWAGAGAAAGTSPAGGGGSTR